MGHIYSIKYHIYEGGLNSSSLPSSPADPMVTLTMANNENITLANIENRGPVFIFGNTTAPIYVDINQTDLFASNGVLHIVDGALLPEWAGRTLADSIPLLKDQFSILTELIPIAFPGGLPQVGGLTIFAPLDSAFEKIDAAVLAGLKNNSAALLGLLANHVVGSIVPSFFLSPDSPVTMYNGMNLTVTMDGEDVMIGDAKVVQTDILAMDGIIHAIDTVLMLPTTNATPPAMPTTATPNMTMPMATPTASAPVAAPVAKPVAAPASASYSMMMTMTSTWMIGSTLMLISHVLMA
jgi:uncharacterized surface protein with fasciclin (FAS1) repeats